MKPPPRWKLVLTVLVALLRGSASVQAEDCNRNGIEDRVEIEMPAIDFRLADEVGVAFAGSLAALDFDGDGDEDLAVDSFQEMGIALLRNDGAARFVRASNLFLAKHSQPIRSADLDGDSDLDLVLVLDFEVEILWNDRDGMFSRSNRLSIGSGPQGVEAADLDGDADLDLITANFAGTAAAIQNISVLLNDGGGSFAPPRNFASAEGRPVLAVGDLDGDGDADALVGTLESGNLLLLENDGRAAFRAAGPPQRVQELRLAFLAPADIDGDGRHEVLALGSSPRILILSHAGGGQFKVEGELSLPGLQPAEILAHDVTGDGRVDIVLPTGCPGLTIIEGGVDGLREPRSFWLGSGSQFLAAADLNGDGLPDLAGVSLRERVFTLLQERSTLSSDCNRNGILDGCEPDCDRNGSPDDCDLSSGVSPDCDSNGVPDVCDSDCDANGVPDACDIGAGRATDCNGNGVPDACEPSGDADGNGSPDACDLAGDPALDCDGNGKLDVEDLEPRPRFIQEEYDLRGSYWSATLADMDGDGDKDIVAGGRGMGGISILEQLEDGSFARPRTYRVEIVVTAIAAVDADRDGDLDVAVGTPDLACLGLHGWVVLLLNQGGFRLGRGPAYEVETTVAFLEPADLDGDGIADLLAGLGFPSSGIWALAGRGDGTFAMPLRIAEKKAGSLAPADLDADGDIDIAAGGGAILLNGGGGSFVEGRPLGVQGHLIAAGDIDGDSVVDLVVQTTSELSVFVNDGRARFTPGESLFPGNMQGAFALGNFDGDGSADIAVATQNHQSGVSVFLSRGANFVEMVPAAPVGSTPAYLLGGDVDADGLDDVIALLQDMGSAIVLKNRGNGSLSSRRAFAAEQVFFTADAGDIDGDLDLDLAVVASEPPGEEPRIALFENDGHASYDLKTLLEHDRQPRFVRLSDLNGDGLPDLIVAEDGKVADASGVSVLTNQGGWSFALEDRRPAGAHVEDLAVADFDADGDADIATLEPDDGDILVFLNDGGGKLGEPRVTPSSIHPTMLRVADADGDALPDLFLVAQEDIHVLRGAGAGRFETPGQILGLAGRAASAAAADIDGDGDDDLLVGRTVGDCIFCWQLEVLIAARGTLASAGNHALDGLIHAPVPADIDGDGDLDILLTIEDQIGIYAVHLQLLMNSGQGLRSGNKVTVGGYPTWLAARDLDGDGDADLVYSGGSGFSVIRNDTPAPALRDEDRDGVPDACERAPFSRGDADQDGSVSLSDAIATLGALFQGLALPACPAALDADDSGRLDITDPVRILGHLFLGRGPLPEPFSECGPDPTPDDLGCSQFGPCA